MISGTYRVTWKGVNLGDHAYVTFNYRSNQEIRVIPRAKGVRIRSTEELGGGYWEITVNALVSKDTRLTLEKYFYNLDSSLELNAEGALVLKPVSPDVQANLTLSDCYLVSLDQEANDLKVNSFTLQFVKSL